MEYAVVSLAIVLIGFIGANRYITLRRERIWAKAKAQWGRTKDTEFNFDIISRFTPAKKSKAFHTLSDQTLQDIDFFDLFRHVDRTASCVGQQYLFHVLTHPLGSGTDLRKLRNEVESFKDHSDHRDRTLRQLSRLSNPDAYYITTLLEEHLSRPRWFRLPILSVVSLVVLLAFGFINPVAWAFALMPLLVNILIHYWNKSNTFQFIRSFRAFPVFLDVAIQLHNANAENSPVVEAAFNRMKHVSRKLFLVNVFPDTGISGELAQVGMYLIELMKAAFLVEFFGFFYLIREFKDQRENIATVFEFIGRKDVVLSVASLMSGSDHLVYADVSEEHRGFSGRNLRHPLIAGCTPNTIDVNVKGILITGSNMAGKTTFLRTVLINSLLAQTLSVCYADEFRSPVVKQISSIRLDDSLAEGKSYFLEEVQTVNALLKNSRESGKCLIVLDEVFKGTNTVERIAAAKAVLSYLVSGGHFVFVSTHDTELVNLLSGQYDIYHFVEEVVEGELRFDHRLKPGPLRTSNAIKILELSGYPDTVVKEAKEISLQLRAHANISQNTHSKNL